MARRGVENNAPSFLSHKDPIMYASFYCTIYYLNLRRSVANINTSIYPISAINVYCKGGEIMSRQQSPIKVSFKRSRMCEDEAKLWAAAYLKRLVSDPVHFDPNYEILLSYPDEVLIQLSKVVPIAYLPL